MCLSSPQQRRVFASLICSLVVACGLASPAGAQDNRLLGALGDPRLLQFKGCNIIPAERVRDELKRDWEVEVAATPSAPLEEYLTTVQRRVTSGYLACGFPNAKVEVTTNPEKSAVVVNVNEGQRYMAGEVKITGTKTVDTAALIKELTTAIPASNFPTQLNPTTGALSIGYWQDNPEIPKPRWEIGKPALLIRSTWPA